MPKKKTALTIEERLQQALVPAEEQPYELPENWVWCRLGAVYSVNPKIKADDGLTAAFIPMEKITAGMLSEYTYDEQEWCKAKKGHTQFADGDVAFAKISPCFENRKSLMLNNLPNGIGGGTTELVILRSNKIQQKYTFWLITEERFIKGGIQTYSGTVGQQRINMDYVRNYPIPLPPLAEQQRIVDRIEELFAKLDEAKEKLEAVVDSFAVRKAAILHKAFTGELTQKWRKENGVELSSWEEKKIKDVIKLLSGQDFPPAKYNSDKNGIPYITGASNFDGDHVLINRWTNEPSVIAKEQDVLLVCKGSGYGKTIIADFKEAHIARQIMALRPIEAVDNNWLLYYIRNSNKYIKEQGQGLIPGLSRKVILELKINLPSLPEQHEIVRLIDSLLARERKAQEAAEQTLASIELMKKAILAQAFRGELGTNRASEASAMELLKQVLEQENLQK